MSWSSDSSRVPVEQQIRDSLIRSLDANGATPSRFLDLLDTVTQPPEDERGSTWQKLRDRRGRPFSKFIDFVTAERPEGLGLHGRDDLTKHLDLQHKEEREPFRRQATVDRMTEMRQRVQRLLGDDLDEALPEKTPGPGRGHVKTVSGTHSFVPQNSHTADAIIARLKRDAAQDPEIAEQLDQVLGGAKKPNKAARDLGWRKPRIVLSTPERVAKRLRDHFKEPEQLALLIKYLKEEQED